MKKITKALLAVMLLGLAAGAYAEDKYDQLAKELTEAGTSIQGKKIAIIPFSYADAREKASKDGSVIAERLTIKMINMHKFEIIERSVLDKVMNELKLQSSGMIDASSAQQLGKVLGVEAIVTGTLVETSGGQIEVNARMIKTETAQAIGASQVTVEKNWIGDVSAAPQAQPQTYQQPAYEQPVAKQVYRRPRGPNEYGFFDVFFGGGSKKIDLTYENSSRGVYMTEIGFAPVGISNGPYSQIELPKMTGTGIGPFGIRVGGFGNGPVGGDFEFSVTQNVVQPQTVSGTRNGVTTTFRLPTTDNYLTMTSFGMSGDLLFRVTTPKVDPYFGIGLGMSLNRIQLPFAYGFTNSSVFSRPVDDFGLGFMLRVPFGARFKLSPKTQIVTELRYELNRVSFTRGSISGESDTIVAQGVRFLIGMGFGF
ncbi:MAG: FlgO family outer membrane protein [Elusimicrobia bacterium]|nr:FlgO family outer membrane protein [Elusimicrobiota bacterium]